MRRGVAALGICGVVAGGALLAAPLAYADSPTLPMAVTDTIAADGLRVEMSNGWEAVAGPARDVNDVRSLASSYGIGTVAMYTGNNETGQAVLIFTGNDNTSPVRFDVVGGTVTSVDNTTDDAWYVFDDNGVPDAGLQPGTASNIKAADANLVNVTLFSFSPSFAVFSF
jgi:hypothetical protein